MRPGKLTATAVLATVTAVCVCGCREDAPPPRPAATQPKAAGPVWVATQAAVITGMRVPESIVIDPATGVGYISNIEADDDRYWADDGKGFISRLHPGGKLDVLRWKAGSAGAPLNAPRGMCVFDGALYIADNTRIRRLALDVAAKEGPVDGLTGKRLNDVATDGTAVYVSDTDDATIYRIDGRAISKIKAPEGINGITFLAGKMFGVSWTLHDVYEIDAEGKADPKAFGLAKHFKTLDGIGALDDGTLVVSDFDGNKVYTISPDRKNVRVLCTPRTPADLTLDQRSGLMYVPEFMHDRVVVYKLRKTSAD